ncbi:3-hexulose-6-phosphate synthase [Sediminibacillus halophilus]|uniref:3-hexulose-6-phosphate synthase n=1 Tax=Sediminibacillus halophilus TaxID=482461 RepID=A0A1G9RED8_9BACI|nr:3-hexulose-6-phosphate synthase [Sediminibacillus halophilus]SDM21594.1 3-hexulose-6-phosphate synthase [Sediminibacillus halophilus]
MKLQVALDRLPWDDCFTVIESVKDSVDFIEIGTGVIKEFGVGIIKEMKQAYPEKTLVADMKICDAGKHETALALDAGADITTVMGFAPLQTIKDCIEVANQADKQIMVDLLGIRNREKIEELVESGADLLSLHIGKDEQKSGGLDAEHFRLVEGLNDVQTAVAGGINQDSLPAFLEHRPDVIIVGSAITKAKNRKEAAKTIKGMIK